MPRGRTLIDPPYIRVIVRPLWRVEGDKVIADTLRFDLPGDPTDPEQCKATVNEVAALLIRDGWEMGDWGHGTLVRVLGVGVD
jgi:hypothetical protein